MYFTVAELTLMLLRRQMQNARHQYRYAKDRGWAKAIRNWQGEIGRLNRLIEAQERIVVNDLARRNVTKAEWLEKLA